MRRATRARHTLCFIFSCVLSCFLFFYAFASLLQHRRGIRPSKLATGILPNAYSCTAEKLDPNFTVAYHGRRFGRLGNVMVAITHLIVHAFRHGCHIQLPNTLIGLEDAFTSRCSQLKLDSLFQTGDVPGDCPNITGQAWFAKGYFDKYGVYHLADDITPEEEDMARSVLRMYTSTNETHAYDVNCGRSADVVAHIRAGDVARGSFDSSGQFRPGHISNAIKRRLPFPTAYYAVALGQILSNQFDNQLSPRSISVLAQDDMNPSSEFFSLGVALIPGLKVSHGNDLLSDLVEMTCAKHLITSRSTLSYACALRDTQFKHIFVDDLAHPSKCDRKISYYSLVDGQTYLSMLNDWKNTAQNRSMINRPWEIVRNKCHTTTVST